MLGTVTSTGVMRAGLALLTVAAVALITELFAVPAFYRLLRASEKPWVRKWSLRVAVAAGAAGIVVIVGGAVGWFIGTVA